MQDFSKLCFGHLVDHHENDMLFQILAGDDKTDAIQRTTTAVTIFDAGVKINVIPSEATASVNHRVHPADNAEGVVQHDRDVIDDDRVNATIMDSFAPSKISPYDNEAMPFQVSIQNVTRSLVL